MPAAIANRLLPIFGGIAVLILAFVLFKSCSSEDASDTVLHQVPSAPKPDADTPADTIKTLTANVAAMTTEVAALRRDNAALIKENQGLIASSAQIEERVASRLHQEFQIRERELAEQQRRDAGALAALSERVDRLTSTIPRAPSTGSDIPIGLGLDGIAAHNTNPGLLWITPLDAPGAADPKPVLPYRASSTAGGLLDDASTGAKRTATAARTALAAHTIQPAYTVPRNATLIGSTAMTALVGRIPIQGQVRDPMPFKVITGSQNLAANGLTVPGVQGMIWSGTAVGDWTLSCVTGRLESVTFVFDDGTIRTISSDDRNATMSGQGGGDAPLGWISDARGIPCLSGERKSNAVSFLSQRIGIKAIQAAADAAAAAETTTTVGNLGNVSGTVTGDVGAYVLGKTVSGGSDEIAKWLLERQSQSFDAVFVPAGVAVAIHVDRELTIDLDPQGRKLTHARTTDDTLPSPLD